MLLRTRVRDFLCLLDRREFMTDVYPVNDWFAEKGLLNEEQYFDMYRRSIEDNE
jgi:hypothetical protein